jgi:hypothetical protein
MIRISLLRSHFVFLIALFPLLSSGATEKYRAMWREDPATSMVIGWHQKSGHSPVLYLDETDHGQDYARYRFSKAPDHVAPMKGMNNHFVRLRGLKPNTVYYFVIRDSEGISTRFSFKTAPDHPSERISIIAGGDSRNNRDVRRDANKLVGKLRPHVILFNGDMIDMDTDKEWQEWFDDWQLIIADDGRITPVIAARGNHELSNAVVATLFDLPAPDAYYALSLGGNLLRVYTLNSMIPAGGPQSQWLERDLAGHPATSWKIVQYHLAIRPHTSRKAENNDQYFSWAPLFYAYNVNLAIESDAHVAKVTWPVRPSTEPDNDEGFVRDDDEGTVYIGEGGWGAPLRDCNDTKSWTRSSGSFNQFNWIFVDEEQMEVRTVRVTNADAVRSVDPGNIFRPPYGLSIWNPENGDVVVIRQPGEALLASEPESVPPVEAEPSIFSNEVVATRLPGFSIQHFSAEHDGASGAILFSTANEPGGMIFELQRSNDGGQTFTTIQSFRGNEKAINEYRYTDLLPAANGMKYRLRRLFPNGESDLCYPNGKITEDLDQFERLPKLVPDANAQLTFAYTTEHQANVRITLVNFSLQEVTTVELPNQKPDKYLKTINLSAIPPGRYMLVIRADGYPVRRFKVTIERG